MWKRYVQGPGQRSVSSDVEMDGRTNRWTEAIALHLALTRSINTACVNYSTIRFTTIRKYSFTAHIVNTWNSPSNSIVIVNTVNLFKALLDKLKFQMHRGDK